jgi:hypothetical protein
MAGTTTESKPRNGILSFGTAPDPVVEFSCQASNVKVTPGYEESGDRLELLCGNVLQPDTTRVDKLTIEAVQDFTDVTGFVNWTWLNDLTTVPFTWQPVGAAGPTYSGNVNVRAVEVGGDVGKRNMMTAEWDCDGKAVRTEAA